MRGKFGCETKLAIMHQCTSVTDRRTLTSLHKREIYITSRAKNCPRLRIEVKPTALPRYHAHTRWTVPLPLASAASCRMPRRASAQLMTREYTVYINIHIPTYIQAFIACTVVEHKGLNLRSYVARDILTPTLGASG